MLFFAIFEEKAHFVAFWGIIDKMSIPLHLWNPSSKKPLGKTTQKPSEKKMRKDRDNQTPEKRQKLSENCETNWDAI